MYQQVLNLSPLDAARALAADFNILEPARGTPAPPRVPTAYDLKRALDKIKGAIWGALCDRKHEANARAEAICTMFGDPAVCTETKSFWAAVKESADAETKLMQLEAASPVQLLAMVKAGEHRV